MFMTPTESDNFFKQINDAFDELKTRITTLESQIKEMQDAKQERLKASKSQNGNNTKTKEKA